MGSAATRSRPARSSSRRGRRTDIRLEWATYYDAADQAGQSRLYGGIHVQADDFTGRQMGAECGKDAWARAQRYYAGHDQRREPTPARRRDGRPPRRPRRASAADPRGVSRSREQRWSSSRSWRWRPSPSSCPGSDRRRRRRPWPPRISWTRPAAPASTTSTTVTSPSMSGAASRSSTATTTASRTSTSPAAASPAALYRNHSPIGGRAALRRRPRSGHRPRSRHGRLSARHRR